LYSRGIYVGVVFANEDTARQSELCCDGRDGDTVLARACVGCDRVQSHSSGKQALAKRRGGVVAAFEREIVPLEHKPSFRSNKARNFKHWRWATHKSVKHFFECLAEREIAPGAGEGVIEPVENGYQHRRNVLAAELAKPASWRR
jgi:hypothetical protein